jgi:hypothetical protein
MKRPLGSEICCFCAFVPCYTSYFHRGTITATFRRSRNDVVIRTDSHRSHH